MAEQDNEKGFFSNLISSMVEVFESAAQNVITFFADSLHAIVDSFTTSVSDKSKEKAQNIKKPVALNSQTKGDDKWTSKYEDTFDELAQWYSDNEGFFNYLIYFSAATALSIARQFAWLKMYWYEQQKEAMEVTTPERPDITSTLQNKWRFTNKDADFAYKSYLPEHNTFPEYPDQKSNVTSYRKQLGFNSNIWNFIEHGNSPSLNAGEIIEESRRFRIPEKETANQLKRIGYDSEFATRLTNLKWHYPSVQDIITFQVREAYYPDYMQKWGSLREMSEADSVEATDFIGGQQYYLPYKQKPTTENSDYLKDCEKVGLNNHWAKKYWAAHWDLPSLYQGYQMLHRGAITETELYELFKAHDILPAWRRPLAEISWRLPTRVDVRRMYDRDVFTTPEQLREVYTKLGYHPSYREHMVEFTMAFYQQKDKEMTRSLIVRAYRERIAGYYPIEKAAIALTNIGYTDTDAYTILNTEKEKMLEEEQAEALKAIKAQYISGDWSWSFTKSELEGEGISSDRIIYLNWQWTKQRRSEQKKISEHVLLEMQAAELFKDKEPSLVKILTGRGYKQKDAKWLKEYADTVIKKRMS